MATAVEEYEIRPDIIVQAFDIETTLKAFSLNDIEEFYIEYGGVTDPLGQLASAVMNFIDSAVSSAVSTLKNAISSIVGSIKSAISGVESAIKSAISGLKSSILSAIDGVESMISSVSSSLQSIGSSISNAISDAISTVTSTISSMGQSIISTVQGVANTIQSIGSSILNAISNAISTVTSTISSVSQTITSTIQNAFATIQNILSSFQDTITNFLQNISSQIQSTLTSITQSIQSISESILNTLQNISTSIQNILQNVSNQIQAVLTNLTQTLQNVTQTITNTMQNISATIQNTIQSFSQTVSQIATTITSTLQSVSQTITSGFQAFLSQLGDVLAQVQNMVQGAIQSMQSVAQSISATIQNAFANIQSFLNNLSATMVSTIQGISQTIQSMFTPIINAIDWISQQVGKIPQLPSLIWEYIRPFIEPIIETIKDIPSKMVEISKAFQGFINPLVGIAQFFEQIRQKVLDFFGSVADWLTTGWNKFVDFVKSIPDKIKDIADKVGQIGQSIYDYAIKPFQDWIGEQIITPIDKYVIAPLGEVGDKVWQTVGSAIDKLAQSVSKIINDPVGFFSEVLGFVIGGLQKIAESVWGRITDFGKWMIGKAISAFNELYAFVVKPILTGVENIGKSVAGFVTKPFISLVASIKEATKNITDATKEPITKMINDLLKPMVTSVATATEEYAMKLVDKLKSGKSAGEVFEMLQFTGMLFGSIIMSQYAFRALAYGIHSLASVFDRYNWEMLIGWRVKVKGESGFRFIPVGVGLRQAIGDSRMVEQAYPIYAGLNIGGTLRHLAKEFKQYPDEWGRATLYGMAIWLSQPMMRLANSMFRNMIPVELPSLTELREITRRNMPTPQFQKFIETMRSVLALRGYNDEVISWLTTPMTKETIESGWAIKIKDRFAYDRFIPISLLYELPTPSDFCHMMIHDIIMHPDYFTQVMQMKGYNADVAMMYYLLHFRYPTLEKLWEFYCRARADMLWLDKDALPEIVTKEEQDIINKYGIGEIPIYPAELNVSKNPDAPQKIMDAIKLYAKWWDYAFFNWFKKEGIEFPSDRLIVLDLMAEIPQRIDARWCVPPDTIILGGNKPICEFKEGDYALYGGKVHEVLHRYHKGKIVVVKPKCCLPFKITPEHPVLVVSAKFYKRRYTENGKVVCRGVFEYSKPYFKPAGELRKSPNAHIQRKHEGDFLVMPRLKGEVKTKYLDLTPYAKDSKKLKISKIPLNEETAWLFGLYVAEGHTTDRWCAITVSDKKKDLIERTVSIIKSIGYDAWLLKINNGVQVCFGSSVTVNAFNDWFGKGAKNKKIPQFILLHEDEKIVKAFLDGYLEGDGYYDSKRNRAEFVTTSKVLAIQLQLLLARFGYSSSITTYPEHDIAIMGKVRHYSERYKITSTLRVNKNSVVRVFDDYLLIPIESVEFEDYDGIVYNLETENHVYLVSGVVVHNCYKWSIISDEELKKIVTARKMHPNWVERITIAECMNALAEERTYARTGVINAFKEGFMTLEGVNETLSHLTDVKILNKNVPVKFLDGEVKLLTLRAKFERALDILRDYFRDLLRGVTENILSFSGVIKNLKDMVTAIAKALGLTNLDLDESYYKLYKDVAESLRKVRTVERIRYWYRYMLYRILYRFSEGFMSKDEFNKTINDIVNNAKLTDEEKKVFVEIAQLMYDGFYKKTKADGILRKLARGVITHEQAKQELIKLGLTEDLADALIEKHAKTYTLSISTLLSYADEVYIPEELLTKKLEILGVPQDEREIVLQVFKIRPIKDERAKAIRVQIEKFIEGYIDENTLRQELSKLGKFKEEIDLIVQYAKVEKEMEIYKLRIDAILNKIRRGALTIEEARNVLSKYITDKDIVEALIEKAVRVYTLSVAQLLSYAEYVDIPEDLLRKKLAILGVPEDEIPIILQVFKVRPLRDEYAKQISEVIKQFMEGMITEEDLRKTLKSLGKSDKEISILVTFAKARKERYKTEYHIDAILNMVKRGAITLDKAKEELSKYIVDEDLIDAIIEKHVKTYTLSIPTLLSYADEVYIPEELLTKKLEILGVPEDERNIILQVFKVRPIKDERAKAIRTQIEKFIVGYIDENTLRQELSKLGKLKEEIDLIVQYAKVEKSMEINKLKIDAILNRLKRGAITIEEATKELSNYIVDKDVVNALIEKYVRVYTLSIATLISYAEYVDIPEELLKRKLEILGVPKDEIPIILQVFRIRPLRDEYAKQLSEALKQFEEGYIDEEKLKSTLKELGKSDKEIQILVAFAKARRWRYKVEYYVDAILNQLRRGAITIDKAREELSKYIVDENLINAMIEKTVRVYTLSIPQLLSYAEYVDIPEELLKRKLEILGVPQDEIPIILQVFRIRPIKDERAKMIRSVIDAYIDGYITKELLQKNLKNLGKSSREIQILTEFADFEKSQAEAKLAIDAILNRLRRGAITLEQAKKELSKYIVDKALIDAIIEKYVRTSVWTPDKLVSMGEYVPIDINRVVEKATMFGYPPDEVKLYPAYLVARNLNEEIGRIITELVYLYVYDIIDEETLRQEIDKVRTLNGEVKKLGVDWIVIDDIEKELIVQRAKLRKMREQYRS